MVRDDSIAALAVTLTHEVAAQLLPPQVVFDAVSDDVVDGIWEMVCADVHAFSQRHLGMVSDATGNVDMVMKGGVARVANGSDVLRTMAAGATPQAVGSATALAAPSASGDASAPLSDAWRPYNRAVEPLTDIIASAFAPIPHMIDVIKSAAAGI